MKYQDRKYEIFRNNDSLCILLILFSKCHFIHIHKLLFYIFGILFCLYALLGSHDDLDTLEAPFHHSIQSKRLVDNCAPNTIVQASMQILWRKS